MSTPIDFCANLLEKWWSTNKNTSTKSLFEMYSIHEIKGEVIVHRIYLLNILFRIYFIFELLNVEFGFSFWCYQELLGTGNAL